MLFIRVREIKELLNKNSLVTVFLTFLKRISGILVISRMFCCELIWKHVWVGFQLVNKHFIYIF